MTHASHNLGYACECKCMSERTSPPYDAILRYPTRPSTPLASMQIGSPSTNVIFVRRSLYRDLNTLISPFIAHGSSTCVKNRDIIRTRFSVLSFYISVSFFFFFFWERFIMNGILWGDFSEMLSWSYKGISLVCFKVTNYITYENVYEWQNRSLLSRKWFHLIKFFRTTINN